MTDEKSDVKAIEKALEAFDTFGWPERPVVSLDERMIAAIAAYHLERFGGDPQVKLARAIESVTIMGSTVDGYLARIAELEGKLAERDADELEWWRCFHCDEVFTDHIAAATHFGIDCSKDTACQIKAGDEHNLVIALRKVEQELESYRTESSEDDRLYYAREDERRRALVKAEQDGFDKAVKESHDAASSLRAKLEKLGVPVPWQAVQQVNKSYLLDANERHFGTIVGNIASLIIRAVNQAAGVQ